MSADRWFITLALAVECFVVGQGFDARQTVTRFCELDANGAQLTNASWQQIEVLFVGPGARDLKKVMVVKHFWVSQSFPEKGRVGFLVDYTPIGFIDSSDARFSPLPETLQVHRDFFVVQPRMSERPKETKEPSGDSTAWRIVGPVPSPHINVEAAIRYANDLGASTKEASVRRNAQATITALQRFR